MPQPGERLDRAEGTQPYKPESRALPPWDVQIQSDWNSRDMSSSATKGHIDSLKASIGEAQRAAKAYLKARGL